MSEKSIYILLTDTGTWFSRMIKLYTKAPYNHTSISLDENLQELYSFGRKVYFNPLSAGFVKEGIDRGVYLYKRNTKCVVYKMSVNDTQYQEILKNIAQFKYCKEQYRYNLLGVMGIAMNKRIIRKNAYTCSQFVAFMLVASGIHAFEKYIELITPEDITKIPKLEIVYEGKLRDYNQQKALIFNPSILDWNPYKANF